MLGPARFLPDDGRSDVAVSQLRPDHLVRLALLDVADGSQAVARRLSFGRRVTDVGPILRPPPAPPERGIPRRADVAVADLAPLDLVRRQQVRATPAAQRRVQLP